jgi:hypothetical protein
LTSHQKVSLAFNKVPEADVSMGAGRNIRLGIGRFDNAEHANKRRLKNARKDMCVN